LRLSAHVLTSIMMSSQKVKAELSSLPAQTKLMPCGYKNGMAKADFLTGFPVIVKAGRLQR
jgi:hypothetical protein